MSVKGSSSPLDNLDRLIFEIRGQKVMLDTNLAAIYGVPVKRLNEQVKRNRDCVPAEYAFPLTQVEFDNLKSQFATLRSSHGGKRKLPWVFAEHGAIMAANVLSSPRAVQMSVFVVRAFLKTRGALPDNRELARKLAALEEELKECLDVHEAAIVVTLTRGAGAVSSDNPNESIVG